MKWFLALVTVLVAPTVVAAAEPARPVDLETVMTAVATCSAATQSGPLDRAVIEAAGWSLGKVEANGEEKPNTMEMRSRPGSSLLMITPPGRDMCMIVGPVENEPVIGAIRARILRAFPGAPEDMGEAGEVWSSGNHQLSFARAGRANTPSVRIIVKGKGAR